MNQYLFNVNANYFYGVHVTKDDLSLDIYNKCMKYGGNCIACGIIDYFREVHQIKLFALDNGYIYPEKYAIVFSDTKICKLDVDIIILNKDIIDNNYAVLTDNEFNDIIKLANDNIINKIIDFNPNNIEQFKHSLGLLGITKDPSIVYDIYTKPQCFYCNKCGTDIMGERWNKINDNSYDLCETCYNDIENKNDYICRNIEDVKLIHKNRINEFS